MSMWVSVGSLNSTSNIMYSTDGRTWTDGSGSFSTIGSGVAYNLTDKWVAVGSGSSNVLISSDGMNWVPASGSLGNELRSVAYGGDKWVTVGQNAANVNIFWSSDGNVWNQSTGAYFQPVSSMAGIGRGNGVAYGNGTWIAVGRNRSAGGANILRSTNGTFWENTIGSFDNVGNGVAYGKDWFGDPLWVAVGVSNDGARNIVWSDNDGQNWSVASGNIGGTFTGVAYGKDKWVAVGAAPGLIRWSPDGKTWNDVSGFYFGDGTCNTVSYDGSRWVIGGISTSGKTMIWSDDGRTWYDVSGTYATCNSVFGFNPYPVPCFVQGTRVLTPIGYKRIEELQSGDYVVTANTRIVKIKLYSFTVNEATTETAPYRIPAGALGNHIPRNDVHVSPRHAVKDSNGHWQIPKYLGKNAIQYGIGEPVTYYHIECPNYYTDNLIVEGMEVESYKHNQGSPGVIYIWDKNINGWERLPPNKMKSIPANPTTFMIYSY